MIRTENAQVFLGSNLEVLPTLPDNSIDAIVTDPPYELGFMGKSWDSSGIAYSVELWSECLRVLKPGGYLLAFSGSRTYHRMVVAIEDSGFEIRDMVSWISNKTFPKSMDVSKAIDKAAGAERPVIGTQTLSGNAEQTTKEKGGTFASATNSVGVKPIQVKITEAATDDAKKWAGWGTALKPTVEPIVMARKPIVGTVAANVLHWGVGGLNIDASRIGTDLIDCGRAGTTKTGDDIFNTGLEAKGFEPSVGRWPANVILDEEAAEILDEQSGFSKSPKTYVRNADGFGKTSFGAGQTAGTESLNYGDSGGASRFFYVARASKKDRNEGLEALENKPSAVYNERPSGGLNQHLHGGDTKPRQNFHPTVKPTALMEYLIRLVTPAGGVVLDPFTGSGSTGKAAILNGYKFIGIELTEEYLPIIKGRLNHAEETRKQTKEEETETLF